MSKAGELSPTPVDGLVGELREAAFYYANADDPDLRQQSALCKRAADSLEEGCKVIAEGIRIGVLQAPQSEPEPVPLFGQPEALLAFLEQAGKGCISGHVSEWPQLRPACRWAHEQLTNTQSESAFTEQVFVVDGFLKKMCDCPPAGACALGRERTLQTACLSRCLVPADIPPKHLAVVIDTALAIKAPQSASREKFDWIACSERTPETKGFYHVWDAVKKRCGTLYWQHQALPPFPVWTYSDEGTVERLFRCRHGDHPLDAAARGAEMSDELRSDKRHETPRTNGAQAAAGNLETGPQEIVAAWAFARQLERELRERTPSASARKDGPPSAQDEDAVRNDECHSINNLLRAASVELPDHLIGLQEARMVVLGRMLQREKAKQDAALGIDNKKHEDEQRYVGEGTQK